MRAREPDRVGDLDRDGVPVHYEVFGSGPATVMMLGCFPVVDGRQWKAQVPYLARHFRVVTIDPRGNGLSGRPHLAGRPVRRAQRRRRRRGDGRPRRRRGVPGRPVRRGRWALNLAHTVAPERVRGVVAIAPLGAAGARDHDVIEHMAHPRWVGDYEGWVELPLRAHVRRAPTRPSSTRTWSRGRSRPTRRRCACGCAPTSTSSTRPRRAQALANLSLPGAGHPRHRGQLPARRARHARSPSVTGGRLVEIEGAGHVPHGPPPRARQHADQGVRRHAHLDL